MEAVSQQGLGFAHQLGDVAEGAITQRRPRRVRSASLVRRMPRIARPPRPSADARTAKSPSGGDMSIPTASS